MIFFRFLIREVKDPFALPGDGETLSSTAQYLRKRQGDTPQGNFGLV
jgi:hypothetical protein